MTTGYQIRYMIRVQAMAAGISFLLATVIFGWALDRAVLKELLSAVLILINGGMIYSYAHVFAVYDKKPYTPMKTDYRKGFMMGVVISLITLVLFAVYNIVWYVWGTDSGLSNWGAIVCNMIFSLWTFAYFGIMGMSHGHIMWYSVAAFLILPPVCSTIGYIAGTKGFNLLEKFSRFTYEKKK